MNDNLVWLPSARVESSGHLVKNVCWLFIKRNEHDKCPQTYLLREKHLNISKTITKHIIISNILIHSVSIVYLLFGELKSVCELIGLLAWTQRTLHSKPLLWTAFHVCLIEWDDVCRKNLKLAMYSFDWRIHLMLGKRQKRATPKTTIFLDQYSGPPLLPHFRELLLFYDRWQGTEKSLNVMRFLLPSICANLETH